MVRGCELLRPFSESVRGRDWGGEGEESGMGVGGGARGKKCGGGQGRGVGGGWEQDDECWQACKIISAHIPDTCPYEHVSAQSLGPILYIDQTDVYSGKLAHSHWTQVNFRFRFRFCLF